MFIPIFTHPSLLGIYIYFLLETFSEVIFISTACNDIKFVKVTRQVLGRPYKVVAEKKKNDNEANWMVSNSAKLDRRTKQHTQFGVSASNGSRDMARTKSWRKK